jgi:hypothetical protein
VSKLPAVIVSNAIIFILFFFSLNRKYEIKNAGVNIATNAVGLGNIELITAKSVLRISESIITSEYLVTSISMKKISNNPIITIISDNLLIILKKFSFFISCGTIRKLNAKMNIE